MVSLLTIIIMIDADDVERPSRSVPIVVAVRRLKIRLVRPRDGAVLCDVGSTQVLGADIFRDYA
jgi:hypothetical protein